VYKRLNGSVTYRLPIIFGLQKIGVTSGKDAGRSKEGGGILEGLDIFSRFSVFRFVARKC
jgi:hypothetical protein